MPGNRPIKHEAWAWFRSELVRLLGTDQESALFAELARRRTVDRHANERQQADKHIRWYESRLADALRHGRPTRRNETTLARWRAIRDGKEPPC